MGVLDALKHLQKKIPGDISLIAFDDCEEWEQYSPPISAIRQDPYKIGTEAARMLTDILESKTQQKPTQKMIPTEYIERASVAPPRNG
jgi:LacI family transcriptional regulator